MRASSLATWFVVGIVLGLLRASHKSAGLAASSPADVTEPGSDMRSQGELAVAGFVDGDENQLVLVTLVGFLPFL